MISKIKIHFIRSLHQKKGREENGQFLAEGSKIVMDLMDSRFPLREIYALPEWLNSHGNLLQNRQALIAEVNENEMGKITALSSPSPVLAVFDLTSSGKVPSFPINDIVLALDGIRDPGNMGTIIRIADWFGIRQVICSEDTVELFNPKVVQATMGSIARVNVAYTSLFGWLSALTPGIPVYGTFLEGNDIYQEELASSGVIIMGNESRGISPEMDSLVNHRIFIPSFSTGNHAESLNASIATAIVCSEFRRRKKI
ncbi:MAG: RNA methyltransferase [Bacteroidota bacterium]|nr:RNA methyltransferase [Bacteroidota bacterium]